MADLSVLVAAETKRLRDSVFGAGETTGAGTPRMAGLREDPLHLADTPSTFLYSTYPLRPQALVEFELAGVGHGWTNLGQGGSKDVVTQAGLVIRRGIHGSGPDDNVAVAGTFACSLNNSSANSAHLLGLYSRYHANKLAGLDFEIGCRVRLVDPATGAIRTRFVGKVAMIDAAPGARGPRLTRVIAIDWLDDASRWSLTPAIGQQVGQRWDAILTAILAQMPTQPIATSFDVGADVYPFATDSSAFAAQMALAEFKKLADSERGLIYVQADGTLKAEGRHTRLLSTASAWTLTDTEIQGLVVPSSRDDIIDTVRVTNHPRIVDPAPTSIVYSQANTIALNPNAPQLLLGAFRDEITGATIGATDIQPLIATTDYQANTVADGTGVDITAGLTIAVSVGGAGISFTVTSPVLGFLTSLQVRGKAVKDQATQVFQYPTTTGKNVVDLDMPYQDRADVAQGAAQYFYGKYNSAYAQARRGTVPGKTAALVSAILQREISDRVTIQETVTGIASDFFINGIEERILPSGHLQAIYDFAPAQDPLSGLYWILGTGVLGTSTLLAPF